MKDTLKILKYVIVLITIVVIAFLGYKVYSMSQTIAKINVINSSEIIEERITEISELCTLEYAYTNAEKTDNTLEIFDIKIPFTEKYLIVRYDGIIKYSTDMSSAKVKMTSDNSIEITIPASEISSHEIDEDSWEYLDQKNGLFNRLKPEDDSYIRKYAKDEMEKRAAELNLSEQADENAISQITQLVKGINPDLNVEVRIK